MGATVSEEIVDTWLQECRGFFTRNNIQVRREEIDLLAFKPGKRIWVEVAVSTRKSGGYNTTVRAFRDAFDSSVKRKEVENIFGTKKYEKWLIYGILPSGAKKREKELKKELKQKGINAIDFKEILSELSKAMKKKGRGRDYSRQYIDLIEAFIEKE